MYSAIVSAMQFSLINWERGEHLKFPFHMASQSFPELPKCPASQMPAADFFPQSPSAGRPPSKPRSPSAEIPPFRRAWLFGAFLH